MQKEAKAENGSQSNYDNNNNKHLLNAYNKPGMIFGTVYFGLP